MEGGSVSLLGRFAFITSAPESKGAAPEAPLILGVVRQVRLAVAPHVIEGTAALPKVKAS